VGGGSIREGQRHGDRLFPDERVLLRRTIPGSRTTRSVDGVPLRLVVIRRYGPDD
jgi:hypothetical protein